MPFALLFIGILLIVVAVRNMQQPFVALVGKDFSGQGNFMYWVLALVAIGSIGYIPKAKPASDLFLVLILLVLLLTRGSPSFPGGGVFKQLQTALGDTMNPSAATLGGSGGATPTSGGITVGG